MYGAKFNPNRTFGVEIEVCGIFNRITLQDRLQDNGIRTRRMEYTHEVMSFWKIVSDGSVQGGGGCELVSPPLKGLAGIAEVKKVMKIVAEVGGRVNSSCGFHVHWDCREATGAHLKNILGLYAKFESVIDFLVPPHRRHNRYCQSVRKGDTVSWISYLTGSTAEEVAICNNNGSPSARSEERYRKVNLNAFLAYGTVEFRQYEGTLNGELAAAWIVFTQCIVERGFALGVEFTETAKPTIGELFRILKACPHHTEDSTVAWMRNVMKAEYKNFKKAGE